MLSMYVRAECSICCKNAPYQCPVMLRNIPDVTYQLLIDVRVCRFLCMYHYVTYVCYCRRQYCHVGLTYVMLRQVMLQVNLWSMYVMYQSCYITYLCHVVGVPVCKLCPAYAMLRMYVTALSTQYVMLSAMLFTIGYRHAHLPHVQW